jgi:hypothetical protein
LSSCVVNVVECCSDADCPPARPTCNTNTNVCIGGHDPCQNDGQCEGWYGNSCCQLQSFLPSRTMYASECSSGVESNGRCQYGCVVRGTVLGSYVCKI